MQGARIHLKTKLQTHRSVARVPALQPAPALVALVLAMVLPPGVRAQGYSAPQRVGTIRDKRINEISGIAPARGIANHYWVHNDSGDRPRLFLIHESGEVALRLKVTGARANDWEDVATGPGPEEGSHFIYIGDIGNNNLQRRFLRIYRIKHPDLTDIPRNRKMRSAPALTVSFRYSTGRHNAEALVVHPKTGDIYVITKSRIQAEVYRLTPPSRDDGASTAVRVKTMPHSPLVTGADLSPDGRRLLVRTLQGAQEHVLPEGELKFDRVFWQPVIPVPFSRREALGEAICYTHDGKGYITSSEGSPAPLHKFVRLPTTPPATTQSELKDSSP